MASKQSDGKGPLLVRTPRRGSEAEKGKSASWGMGLVRSNNQWGCGHQERHEGTMEENKRQSEMVRVSSGFADRFTQDHLLGFDEDVISQDKNLINFKIIKKFIGFMVYVAQTYTSLVHYLKGFYLTPNSW